MHSQKRARAADGDGFPHSQWFERSYKCEHPRSDARYLPMLKAVKSSGFFDSEQQANQCLYPGSYIHVTPSLCFSSCTYVDPFVGAKNHVHDFFQNDRNQLTEYLLGPNADDNLHIEFIQTSVEDFAHPKRDDPHKFDVLLSFSAPGRISEVCAPLVRRNGLLLVNDEHGDASLAYSQEDVWRLVGLIQHVGTQIQTDPAVLDTCFCGKSGNILPHQALQNSGMALSKRPFKYTTNPVLYIFQKT